MLLNATRTDELDLETEAERDLEAEREQQIYEALIAACRAVVRNVGGFDKAAAALQVIWGPTGRHVDGDKLRACLGKSAAENRQYFRLEWILWFATQSEDVRDLFDEMTGKGKPKKSFEQLYKDLCRVVREDRYDDILLAAAVCVKEVEMLVAKRPVEPRFRVFAQAASDDGFQGFAPESAPPTVEALAS